MKIINPATEELIKEIEEDNESSIQDKFKLLQKGQKIWAGISLKERIDLINRFSDLLAKRIEDLSSILTSEVGKPLQQSRNEINGARTRMAWLCSHAEPYLSDEWMNADSNPAEKIVYVRLFHKLTPIIPHQTNPSCHLWFI